LLIVVNIYNITYLTYYNHLFFRCL